jgi:hypothetical protein
LCLGEGQIQNSHFLPAAIYPKGQEYEFVSRAATRFSAEHVRQPLLCLECERRFNTYGESQVLRAIATKSVKRFPLHEQLRLALPREIDGGVQRYAGYDVGLDMDKFAYFALSIAWRATHTWLKADGTETIPIGLGGFGESIRKYLLGAESLPERTAVIVIVGSDTDTRKSWYYPEEFIEANSLNVRFWLRGIFFRVMLGRHVPDYFMAQSCVSPRKCLFYADHSRLTRQAFEGPPWTSGPSPGVPSTGTT